MQTSFSQQIKSTAQAKTLAETINKFIDGQDILGLNKFLLTVNKELPDLDSGLNDAGATIASLMYSAKAYESATAHDKVQIAVEFFESITKSNV